MNHTVTTREELLMAAENIMKNEGADKLNIRRLAGRLGIAIGSVYNYFPSKSELVLAVTENYWRRVFHSGVCQMPMDQSFLQLVEDVYGRLAASLPEFQAMFRGEFDLLDSDSGKKGMLLGESSMAHMKQAFLMLLKNEGGIPDSVWTNVFTAERFVDFVFANMFQMLMSGSSNCEFLLEMIRRTVYKKA